MNETIIERETITRRYELRTIEKAPYFVWMSFSKTTGKGKEMPFLYRKFGKHTYIQAQSGSNRFYLQREVWRAYNGDIPADAQLNFINGDRLDCRIENLELENKSEKYTNLIKKTREQVGTNMIYAKWIICVETGQKFKGAKPAAEWVKANSNAQGNIATIKSSIYSNLNGEYKTTHGYTFEFTEADNEK